MFLGSARPKLAIAYYLTGAVVMSLVMGVVLIAALRGADLSRPDHHDPRYGLRLGLGVLLLVAALVVSRRAARDGDEPTKAGLAARLATSPTPRSAFLVGVLVFAPGATFLAALQVIATARAGLELTAAAVVVVVVLNVLFVWLPLVLYLAAPHTTTRHLTSFNEWLRAHGRSVLVAVLGVAGAIMIANGFYGFVAVKG